LAGERLAHYRIVEKLGSGGMGEVWKAHDLQLDRDVALKALPTGGLADTAARARLLHEARTASKLNHPHICSIYSAGESDGQVYIAMELVEGRTLNALLAEGPLPVKVALRLGLQVADALAHAHQHGIIHRDLKSCRFRSSLLRDTRPACAPLQRFECALAVRPRMVRGQDGSLLLSCMTLAFTTSRRFSPTLSSLVGCSSACPV